MSSRRWSTDLHEALGEIIRETVDFWCRQFVEAGMPPERLTRRHRPDSRACGVREVPEMLL
jgi:hypothetical protein